jgi:hypothetical protein
MPGMGIGAIEDQRSNPLRIGGGEQHAHRPAFGDAEQRGALGDGCVHNGAHVVHSLFQRGDPGSAVREAGAALIEHDQPRKGR